MSANANNIEDKYLPLRVENAMLLENFDDDGDGRVDRVGDYADNGFGGILGNTSCQITNDTRVDLVEK